MSDRRFIACTPERDDGTGPSGRLSKPTVSLLVSDLSRQGAGRWGGGVRPFLLGQALQRAGYPVQIVGFSTTVENPGWDTDLPVCKIPLAWGQSNLRAVQALWQHLTGDIIYAYKLKPSSFGLALLHRLRYRRPLVLDIDDWELSWHGGDHYRYRPTPQKLARDLLKPQGALRQPDHPLYLKTLEAWVARADLVTTHTPFLQQRFGGVIIPNGKDTELFNPDRYCPETSRAAYGLQGYRVLMFPGAPRPYKGLEDVLMALDQLGQDDLKLVIVGGSPYDDYDRTLMELWPDRIVHLGQQPYRDMPRVMAAAHVVVVPQRAEPAAQAQFPLKLTDGMAMAKPILATRVGPLPAILGGTGYLADPDQPADLAAQLQAIFANWPAAQSRGRQARQRCCEHYSLDAMATQLHRAFAALC